jgi:hypothetical protein
LDGKPIDKKSFLQELFLQVYPQRTICSILKELFSVDFLTIVLLPVEEDLAIILGPAASEVLPTVTRCRSGPNW